MKKNVLVWLMAMALIGTGLMQSCRNKFDYIDGTATIYDNSKTVVASVYGIVTDDAGMPVENADVSTGGYSTQTDANGVFYFNNITTPEHNTSVKVIKAGYFTGFRSLMVKAGDKHQLRLALLKKDNPQNFMGASGGTISTGTGLSITFPAAGVVNKATGTPYYGQVFVYAKRIDPTTELGLNSMPGDLRGVRTSSEERLLVSYGMMVAELYDASGNALQMADQQEATITLDVPVSMAGAAPASIPLWYFDEVKGIWVEQGNALLQGNKYIGKVKHFSFWNCDTPEAAIQLEMTLIDQNGNPLSGYQVKLTNTANGDTRYGMTNSSGWVGGLCYPNATLTMTVYANNVCGTIALYSQTVTTSGAAQNLGNITINLAALSSSTVSGTVLDCAGASLSNSSVVIMPYGIIVTPNALGQFSYSFPCTPTTPVTVYAYDLSNNVYGSMSTTLISGANNLGSISACGNVTPFLNITLTNTVTSISATKNFLSPSDNVMASLDSLGGNPFSNIQANSLGGSNAYVYMQASDSTVGTHTVNSAYMFGIGTFSDTQFTINSGNVTYTSFPLFPGDVIGSFTLNLTGNPSGNTYTATGNFRAPRNN
ncbi:MAG: carboxypeptidase regulatory-like domain-containing protein [Chitinophagaceae bacterium]|nr:carboxypeptidase regulatory-like domain-containing protein [Chitinophagaceae bacterium]